MKIIDLTHPIAETMPMYPGTGAPKLHIAYSHEEFGIMETLISMYSHTGTHIDAPAHIYADGLTLDRYPIEQFAGSAVIVDCRDLPKGVEISTQLIEKQVNAVNETDFVLFLTGYDKLWGSPDYFQNFPILSHEAIAWVNRRKLKGIGIDAPSFDPVTSEELEQTADGLHHHRAILKTNHTLLLENLCRLDEISSGAFTLYALPLNTVNADGAPARIIAVVG